MRRYALSALIALAAIFSAVAPAAAHHLPIKAPPGGPQLAAAYLNLYTAADEPGRNLVRQGRPKDGRVHWPTIRRGYITLWREVHPGDEREHVRRLNTPEAVWARTGSTWQTLEAVFRERGTPAGEQAIWRCIIRNESGGVHDVWFGGARGWQPQYSGSDRVNGVMQMRPYHVPGERVVTYRSYTFTSYPPWAIRKGLSLGLGPFFAQAGRCF